MVSKFRTSTVLVALTVFSLVLGACASATAAPTVAPTVAPTSLPATGPTTAPATEMQVVMISQHPALGNLLTDTKGMTLYIFKKDAPGASNCYDQCATSWPPLLVPNGTKPTGISGFTGTLSTIQRKDGTYQVAVNNQPVYTWAKDKKAGDVNGQGVGNVWYVLDASGAVVSTLLATPTAAAAAGPVILVAQNATLGNILTDSKGMTLYIYTKDAAGVSNCTGDCAGIWPPLTVPQGSTPTADIKFTGKLGTIQRADGTTQVTVNDMPVYLWVKDKNPGDTTGQNVGKVWFVLDATGAIVNTVPPTAAPASSSLIMVAATANLGSVLVDSKGMTLYIYTKDTPGVSNCSGGCAAAWPPLTVASGVTPTADSKVTGKLGTIQRADGTTQVTVNGMPVYYFAKDKNPGDTTGQNVGKVWFVLDATGAMVNTVPPTAAPASSPLIMVVDTANLGSILTDSKGMTLYIYTKDTTGVSNCSGGCAAAWPPLTVASGVTPTADSKFTGKLGTIQRADGTTQVTVNGMPVYYFAKDKNPGDATGQKVGSVWFVIDATGAMMNK